MSTVSLIPIQGIPLVQPDDDLVVLLMQALEQQNLTLADGDVLVVTSKIVSKAEGRVVRLTDVQPSADAEHYAELTGKDPRLVELVLQESTAVSRVARGVLVVVHRLGFICANAGIDQSNLVTGDDGALLLPVDPDQSAAEIRQTIADRLGVSVGVVISDSHGRPFRMGNVGVAIGVAGLPALLDLRGQADLYDRKLKITLQGYADLIASASQLVSGEGDEGLPIILLRGLSFPEHMGRASDLNRPVEQDLYR